MLAIWLMDDYLFQSSNSDLGRIKNAHKAARQGISLCAPGVYSKSFAPIGKTRGLKIEVIAMRQN